MSLIDTKAGSGQKKKKLATAKARIDTKILMVIFLVQNISQNLKKNKKYKSRKQKDRKTRQKDNKTRQRGIKEKKMKEPEIKFRKVK